MEARFALPSDVEDVDVAFDADGSLLAWSHAQRRFWRLTDAGPVEVELPAPYSAGLRALDSLRPVRLVRSRGEIGRGQGAVTAWRDCPVPLAMIADAMMLDSERAAVVGVESDSAARLLDIDVGRCVVLREQALASVGELSPWEPGFALAYRDPSKGVELFAVDASRTGSLALAIEDAERGDSSSSSRSWIGLKAIHLGSGSLQLLADPYSLERLIVLRDREGVVIRIRPIRGVWAPRDAHQRSERLVVLVRDAVVDARVYRWRWGRR